MHRISRRPKPPRPARAILQQISEVVHNPVRERFELWIAGDLVGVLGYSVDETGGQRTATILHTVLYDEYSGHGLATRLTGTAVDFMRESGMRVRPVCSFTKHYLASRPGAATLAPA
ncbi:GNAT family N-acetyltransferase [Gordonia caeni]|uniref:N-acetyltransferase domain-containing protein n=1 Tax=Gordonia caeni TaxID=1007097 RepID=A0ABP7PP96_9ACTN